jgi:hypothetical protein
LHQKQGLFVLLGKTLYILESQKHGRFYVGSTDDLSRRLNEHNAGRTKSTASGKPLQFDRIIELRWSSSKTLKEIDYSPGSDEAPASSGIFWQALTCRVVKQYTG